MPAEIVQLHPDKTADIAGQIRGGLMRPAGQKELPTMLLYDERGLRLYDDITTKAPEYYLFGAEEEILKNKADEIVRAMHQGEKQVPTDEVVLELGAGALRKTSHILAGLSRLVPEAGVRAPITYYALDLEEREIERTLGEISASDIGAALHGRVETKGICGTYDDGLKLVQEGGLNTHRSPMPSLAFANGAGLGDLSPISSDSSSPVTSSGGSEASPPSTPGDPRLPLHILFLGSSLGNFPRDEQATFLRSLPLRAGVGDTLLLGMDHDNDKAVIEEAYNDPKGYTRNFIMNGLRAAGRALGNEQLFDESKWEYINHYNVELRQHEAFFKSKCAQTVHDALYAKDISFLEGEVLKIEQSYKFSENDAFSLLMESNLRPIQRWTDSSQKYSLWLLERPPFSFPLLKAPSETSTPFGVPSMQDWEQVWSLWDCITRQMIPPSMLYQKPIDLRHICLFYLGHIPTFLDIHLSRLLNEPHTEPQEYKYIFERGIDPHVEDPTQICHSHSDVPKKDEDWPTPTAIAQFQTRVRARLRNLYDEIAAKKVPMTRKIARVLFMTLEHEALHAETLLYMLIQRAGTGTLPPPGFAVPPWTSLAATWDSAPQPKTKTVTLGPALVTLGHDDAEADDTDPVLATKVDGHEFGWDNEHPKRTVQVAKFEIEWRPVTNGQFYDFYTGAGKGKVQLPASWVDEGGEIRVRTLYGPVPLKTAHQWPVITSYHNLSTYATVKGGRLPTEPELRLFYEKFESGYEGGANIGFRNWHPVPATTGGERTAGKGSNGGVWEWTSTSFDKYDGFVPSKLYPGYSMDFFDGIHQVVLGGSYATIPRIAERKTFRNWYQSNYPYPWVGGRVAYDVAQ
ncbi:putative histidine-specific methyltransferase, SAM-dependent [Lyophyllum shimeji]|uniref:Histidine-specific methyltransferase, SAM-dependent n=1 Tax=Lyophyllum shimeji TaxID=47721 RepID=A0A9P3PNE6_LYOSH|nr:putative histidine-specific methyltransferase, SAM-dependent [Lyophyllum shimeji]